MSRRISYFAALVGAVCVGFVIYAFFVSTRARTIQSDVIQGALIGYGLAFVAAQVVAKIKTTKVNGWITMPGCGVPGNGMLVRAACAQVFPGPINSPEEAVYWWTNVDGSGRSLNGERDYVMRFRPGGLPPNGAFWSLTMGTSQNRFVPNPLDRYSVGDRSGLTATPDGSVDIYLQADAPAGHESNWLPAPRGGFILWLRVYVPGRAILDGAYTVPPVERTR